MHDYNYVLGQYKIDKHTEEIFPERRFLSIVPLWVASRLTMPGIHFSFGRVVYLMYDMTRGRRCKHFPLFNPTCSKVLSLEMVTFGFLLRQELVFLSVRGEIVEGTTFGLSPFLTVAPLNYVSGLKGIT